MAYIKVQAQGGAILKEFATENFTKEDKQTALNWISEQGREVIDTYTSTLAGNFVYVVRG